MRSHIIQQLLLVFFFCPFDKRPVIVALITNVYSPCSYPWPGTEEFRKCSGYFHVPFLCDPEGMLSLTEAEELTNLVEANYTSCICDRHYCGDQIYQGDKLNFGLAIIPRANSSGPILKSEMCQKNLVINSEANWDSQLGQIYADTIKDRWGSHRCRLDVLVVAIHIWVWPNISNVTNRVFVSLSPKAARDLDLNKRLDLLKLIVDDNSFSPSGTKSLIAELLRVAKLLTSPTKKPQIEGIPVWALATFVLCTIFGLLLAVIGHLISRKSTHTNRNASASTMIACKKTWQAGFAGGLWQDTTTANTAF